MISPTLLLELGTPPESLVNDTLQQQMIHIMLDHQGVSQKGENLPPEDTTSGCIPLSWLHLTHVLTQVSSVDHWKLRNREIKGYLPLLGL